jgi:hypothetical protein
LSWRPYIKACYAALFEWLVVQINTSFAKEPRHHISTISILDIYGENPTPIRSAIHPFDFVLHS